MSESINYIPNRIKNAAVGGHVCGAVDIIDDALGLEQSSINEDVAPMPYNDGNPNGMGRIILKKTDNFKNVVEAQSGNTIFIIKYDFILTGNVNLPVNCVLEFEGGSVSENGTGKNTITFNSTYISGIPKFKNINFSGSIKNDKIYNTWFGIKPNDVSTNNDVAWNLFISNATALKQKAFIVNGEYATFSTINITTNHTIIEGESMREVIFYYMPDDTTVFMKIVANACELRNLTVERTWGLRHKGIGIMFGDYTLNYNGRCTGNIIRDITVARFGVGVDFSYAWNNSVIGLNTNFNEIGTRFEDTECDIVHFVSEGNVIGLQTTRHRSAGDPKLSISHGTIEDNGIGCIFESGVISLNGIYMEKNHPMESNEAANYHYNDDYPNGAEIICGTGTYHVNNLAINNCYVGHNDAEWSSLFYIDKCDNLNIIGTFMRNLVTTANTRVSNKTMFPINRAGSTWQPSGISINKTSSIPCISRTLFSAADIDGNGRLVIGCGFAFNPIRCTISTNNEGSADITRTSTTAPNITIYAEGDYISDGIYTIVLMCKLTDSLSEIVVNNTIEADRSYAPAQYTNRDNIFYLPVRIEVENGQAKSTTLKFYGENNQILLNIKGVCVYDGEVNELKIDNSFDKIINSAKVTVAEKALLVPTNTPSTRTFDLKGNLADMPMVHFDTTSHKLLIRYNGVDYDATGTPV